MDDSNRPMVSVVIPTRDRRDAVGTALRSLGRQTAAPDSYEVIVSVDGSTDGTAAMLAGLAPAHGLAVTEGPPRGRAAACNAAIALARGEVVIVLDDDMDVVPEFVERHRRHHPPRSRVCVMGAVPVRRPPGAARAAAHVAARFDAHMAELARPGHVFVPRDFYSGNASVRAEVLRELGGFDESFAEYGNEDVELCVRMLAAGVALRFDPEAIAHQTYQKGLVGLARDTRAKGRTSVQLVRRHPQALERTRLAAPRDGSRPWLALRAVLLALTRRFAATPELVFAFAAALEHAGLSRSRLDRKSTRLN